MKRFTMLLLAVALLSACSVQAGVGSSKSETKDMVPIDSMEWSKLYDNVDQLIDASELIVTGKVIKSETLMVEDLVFTNQTIEIIKTLKGDIVSKETIVLRRTGGEFEGHKTKYLEGEQLLEDQKVYLLFLTRYADKTASFYLTTGAYQGSAILKDDDSLVAQVNHDKVTKELEQLTLEDIAKKVK